MATLTEVSGVARKVIKFGIIFLIALMLFPVAVRVIKAVNQRLNPPPPPPPTVAYGKLPKLIFPTSPQVATPEYVLETIGGGLPGLPDTARAYVTKINRSRLKSPDDQRSKARNLGFTNDFLELDEQTYKFVHPRLPAEMVVNIISGGFAYKFDWTTENQIYTNQQIPVGERAVNEAKDWLQGLSLLPPELAGGSGKTQYFVATGSAMIPAESFYDANFTRVDLFRQEKDKLPVVTSGGDTSPVNMILTGLPGEKRVVQANYQFSITLDNDFATYPLIGIQEAYNRLIGGKGYIAKRAGPRVVIRKAYLAYYEANVTQDFLQAVYVFEGDSGFMGYVQAVRDEYIQ